MKSPVHSSKTAKPCQLRKARPVSFAEILKLLEPENVIRLKDVAFLANRLAKITCGNSKSLCYDLKHRAIDQLLRLGFASPNSLILLPQVRVGVTFHGGGMLHVDPRALSLSVQSNLLRQIETEFETKCRRDRAALPKKIPKDLISLGTPGDFLGNPPGRISGRLKGRRGLGSRHC